jgi:hypothetical protein
MELQKRIANGLGILLDKPIVKKEDFKEEFSKRIYDNE